MRMKSIVYHNVVFHFPVKTFPEFYSTTQAEVIVDMIIGGSVIQINIPAMVAPEAVIAYDACMYGIPIRHLRIFPDPGFTHRRQREIG